MMEDDSNKLSANCAVGDIAAAHGFYRETKDKLLRSFQMVSEILQLPVARLCFYRDLAPERVTSTFRYFTKPHPRYKLFGNKCIGAALIDLSAYADSKDWLRRNNGSSRTSAAYRSRKAKSRGYQFGEIDKNDFVDDVYEINTSLESRQGRKMDSAYLKKETRYLAHRNYRYFGVRGPSGKLVAYCDLGIYGNFAVVSRLLGHRDCLNDGVMYLLLVEIIARFIDEQRVRYIMYDTWYGAQSGLRSFKTKFGFTPHRVKYRMQ